MSVRGKWGDLGKRVFSAAVLIGFGAGLAFASGVWLRLGVSVVIAGMIWELARMTAWAHPEFMGPRHPIAIAALGGIALFFALNFPGWWSPLLMLAPGLMGLSGAQDRLRLPYFLFATAIMIAGFGLVELREMAGMPFVLWLVGTVVASDVLGYFVGKSIGGRKFWPSISPNKTWSGTAAGWGGSVVIAALIVASGHAGATLIVVAPLVAFAGQMGDIAESWIKRRAGVKDSSNLLPGHGGLMDRFDALTGAILAVMLMGALIALPEVF